MRRLTLLSTVLGLVLVGCSQGTEGTLTGHVSMCRGARGPVTVLVQKGAPVPVPTHGLSKKPIYRPPGGEVTADYHLTGPGNFHFMLPPGTYSLWADSGAFYVRGVKVQRGETVTADVLPCCSCATLSG